MMSANPMMIIAGFLTVSLAACSGEEPGAPAQAVDPGTEVRAAVTNMASSENGSGRGEKLYAAHCAACHQANGQGLAGAFPPLAESDYLAGGTAVVIDVILNGLSGPITVNGKNYNSIMPNLRYLSDSDVADVVTFVMNAWGNPGGNASSAEVAAVRAGETVTGPSGQNP